MITSVQLQNFKNHRSTNISLGRINVLVGPNASGKTSVLQALHTEHRCRSDLNVKYFKISNQILAQPSYTEKYPPYLQSDGGYLASVLAHLIIYAPEKFQNLLSLIQRIIPAIHHIRVRPAHIRPQEQYMIEFNNPSLTISDEREAIGHELIFDMLNGNDIPAHSIGEGILAVLCILTMVIDTESPTLILLDDIEQNIHPWAQRTLMDILKELLER